MGALGAPCTLLLAPNFRAHLLYGCLVGACPLHATRSFKKAEITSSLFPAFSVTWGLLSWYYAGTESRGLLYCYIFSVPKRCSEMEACPRPNLVVECLAHVPPTSICRGGKAPSAGPAQVCTDYA